jgi:hypothetical protein
VRVDVQWNNRPPTSSIMHCRMKGKGGHVKAMCLSPDCKVKVLDLEIQADGIPLCSFNYSLYFVFKVVLKWISKCGLSKLTPRLLEKDP